MVNMLSSSAVDCGFISGVMVNMLSSSAVDRRFIGGVMVNMLSSSAVDRRFEPWSFQTKYYNIGTCCFSAAKYTALSTKTGWL
jgi:hypothetical protein